MKLKFILICFLFLSCNTFKKKSNFISYPGYNGYLQTVIKDTTLYLLQNGIKTNEVKITLPTSVSSQNLKGYFELYLNFDKNKIIKSIVFFSASIFEEHKKMRKQIIRKNLGFVLTKKGKQPSDKGLNSLEYKKIKEYIEIIVNDLTFQSEQVYLEDKLYPTYLYIKIN